ncbi:hypothetical protein Dimus_007273 [Dionaea muscipula]
MSLAILFFLLQALFLLIPSEARQNPRSILSQYDVISPAPSAACPLNFTLLIPFYQGSWTPASSSLGGVATVCQYIRQGLRLVESEYLRRTNSFLPPLDSAESCWDSYQSLVDEYSPNFDIRSSCGFQTSWISEGCMNITTRAEFESRVNASALNAVVSNCNQSLENGSPCASCTTTLSTLQASYLTGNSVGNLSDCTAYPSIYAAAFANVYGPTDPGTADCLFSLNFSDSVHDDLHHITRRLVSCLIGSLGFSLLVLTCSVCFVFWWRRRRRRRRKRVHEIMRKKRVVGFGGSIGGSTHLVKFSLDEIKEATRNFSRANLIGKGGYGNVYKGLLSSSDGSTSEVAVKRFKNTSSASDVDFAHEVEVIASVRHVNLVALVGYCVETNPNYPMDGHHQRIIVCDLMKNGSLHDHLFGEILETEMELEPRRLRLRLSWPVRQRIALGMARGLSYLHYGAQPSIIHRDIKASNILLDDKFEAKVCDFGLAKFSPDNGASHLSTRVAGTRGYVAPEYALYGQLTERSDVYSFGVVLLELLSGRKAIISGDDGQPQPQPQPQPCLLADWAWSLVRSGNTLDVIEDRMPEMGSPELMEKYVLVAVLCSHPQVYARPTMDQVVRILESDDLPAPSIPNRPIPLIAHIDDIQRSVTSNASSSGYQYYSMSVDGKEVETSFVGASKR